MPRLNTTTADIVPDERLPPLPALPRTGSAAGPSALERAVPALGRAGAESDWRQQAVGPHTVNGGGTIGGTTGADMQPPPPLVSHIKGAAALPVSSYPPASNTPAQHASSAGLHTMVSAEQAKATGRGFPRGSPIGGMPISADVVPTPPTATKLSAPPPSRSGPGGENGSSSSPSSRDLSVRREGPAALGYAHTRSLPASLPHATGAPAFASLPQPASFPVPALPPPPPPLQAGATSMLSLHDERILAPFLKPRAKRRREQLSSESAALKTRRSSESASPLDGAAAGTGGDLDPAAMVNDDEDVKVRTATVSSGSPNTPVDAPGGPSEPDPKRKRPPARASNRPEPVLIDGKKRYPCGICTLTFSTSGHAARHSRIHRGSRPYVCTFPGCGNRFSRQDNSLQHYKTHVSASRSSRDNELGYLLKSAAEIAQEDRYIALGKKALLDGTAIAVMHDVVDNKGKKTGEKLVRSVGADMATRLPRSKHDPAPPAHVIQTAGQQAVSHQATAALDSQSHESSSSSSSSRPTTMVGTSPMGVSLPVQNRLVASQPPSVASTEFAVGSAAAPSSISCSTSGGAGHQPHEMTYSTSASAAATPASAGGVPGPTDSGASFGSMMPSTVSDAFADRPAVSMAGPGVPAAVPASTGTRAPAPRDMSPTDFGPAATSAFPRGSASSGTAGHTLGPAGHTLGPTGSAALPPGGMAAYHMSPVPVPARQGNAYGDVAQPACHGVGGTMSASSPVTAPEPISVMTRQQASFVPTTGSGPPTSSGAAGAAGQFLSPSSVIAAGPGVSYTNGASCGAVGSQSLAYASWGAQSTAPHHSRSYPPPRQTGHWRTAGSVPHDPGSGPRPSKYPEQHGGGFMYHSPVGYGPSPTSAAYYPQQQGSPSHPMGPYPWGPQGPPPPDMQAQPPSPGPGQGWRPRNEFQYN